ncbi:MAG: hypothetical protein AAF125_03665 [Chloroflexota bacterium]
MSYTLEIIALECLKNQELDGDEIVIKFNDQVMFHWEDTGYRWAAELKLDDWTNFYNFNTNKLRTMNGEVFVEAYADHGFLLEGLEGENVIGLWESDEGNLFRGQDDDLGQLVINEASASNEMQTHDYTGEGAHYRLTYAVVAEAGNTQSGNLLS